MHAWHDMRIEVERDADRRVSEPFTGNLGVHAGGEQLRSVRVPGIVEADPEQGRVGNDAHPLMGERSRLYRAAVGLRHNKGIVINPDAQPQLFFGAIEYLGKRQLACITPKGAA